MQKNLSQNTRQLLTHPWPLQHYPQEPRYKVSLDTQQHMNGFTQCGLCTVGLYLAAKNKIICREVDGIEYHHVKQNKLDAERQ